MTEALQEVNCEKCGLIAGGLTEEQGTTFARAHLLEHEQAGKSVIVTVEAGDPWEGCPPWKSEYPSLIRELGPYIQGERSDTVFCTLCKCSFLADMIPQHEQQNRERHPKRGAA
jgi:hypothetical protein